MDTPAPSSKRVLCRQIVVIKSSLVFTETSNWQLSCADIYTVSNRSSMSGTRMKSALEGLNSSTALYALSQTGSSQAGLTLNSSVRQSLWCDLLRPVGFYTFLVFAIESKPVSLNDWLMPQ